jgi:hypothetical protein
MTLHRSLEKPLASIVRKGKKCQPADMSCLHAGFEQQEGQINQGKWFVHVLFAIWQPVIPGKAIGRDPESRNKTGFPPARE